MKADRPRTTLTLAALTVAAYAIVAASGRSDGAALVAGFIPARVGGPPLVGALPVWLTPLTATLLHGGLLHLGFNLLMLVFCGREDEVALGPGGTALLYGIGAYAGALGDWVVAPGSTVPMIGASGAISALVGAYALLYGQRRPSHRSPEVARWLHVAWLAAAWIGIQLLLGYASATRGVGIAIAAHIGGFLAGLVLARPLLRFRYRHA